MNARTANAMMIAVAQAGEEGVPEGFMFAPLMGEMSLDEFNLYLAFLVEQEYIVRDRSFLVTPTKKLSDLYAAMQARKAAKAGGR